MPHRDFNGKKILILGLGLHGGGVETVKFFLSRGAHLTITDRRSRKELRPALKEIAAFRKNCGLTCCVKYTLAEHKESDFLGQDFVVKNPAIPPFSPWLELAKKNRIPVISDVGIFFLNSAAPIIGVTGTRGKSTTAYLISRFLQESGSFKNRVFLGGNIRRSVLEFLPRLRKKDIVILELSSFQLADLREVGVSPHIAVITNIYRDHLNWHQTFRNYVESKKNIFRFQKRKDYLFLNPDDKTLRGFGRRGILSNIRYARLGNEYNEIVEKKLGGHYFSSVALAIAVADFLGVRKNSIKNTLRRFKGLEGRQEEVTIVKGVHFINDTTSTIPEATVAALVRFRKKISNLDKRKIILIAGGEDKNLDFKKLISSVRRLADMVVFLPGTATDKIKSELRKPGHNPTPFYFVNNMNNAVRKAFSFSSAGDYVILSPGAASFGLFLNEFDRGKKFMECVKRLQADS